MATMQPHQQRSCELLAAAFGCEWHPGESPRSSPDRYHCPHGVVAFQIEVDGLLISCDERRTSADRSKAEMQFWPLKERHDRVANPSAVEREEANEPPWDLITEEE